MKRGATPAPQRAKVLKALKVKADGDAGLRAAVREAHDAGGSVRDIAEFSGLSTNTIQRWLREK